MAGPGPRPSCGRLCPCVWHAHAEPAQGVLWDHLLSGPHVSGAPGQLHMRCLYWACCVHVANIICHCMHSGMLGRAIRAYKGMESHQLSYQHPHSISAAPKGVPNQHVFNAASTVIDTISIAQPKSWKPGAYQLCWCY